MQERFFSFSIVSLFIKNTCSHTHTQTHNNNSRQSIPTADYLFCRCAEGQITHVTLADHVFKRRWFGKVKLPQILSEPPGRQSEVLMRLLHVSDRGKAQWRRHKWWHLLLKYFFQEEENRRIKLDTLVLFFFSSVNVNNLCKGTWHL